MDQDTTVREITGPGLLGPLTSDQAGLLAEKFRAAYFTVGILKDGTDYGSQDYNDLGALWDDMWGASRDASEASNAARERETSPETMAAARRANHLDAITRAEQLLAAERAQC